MIARALEAAASALFLGNLFGLIALPVLSVVTRWAKRSVPCWTGRRACRCCNIATCATGALEPSSTDPTLIAPPADVESVAEGTERGRNFAHAAADARSAVQGHPALARCSRLELLTVALRGDMTHTLDRAVTARRRRVYTQCPEMTARSRRFA